MRNWRPYYLVPLLAALVATACAVLCAGCSRLMYTPGGEVRRAQEHRQEYGWLQDGFKALIDGPQANRLKMTEETRSYDEEGRITEESLYSLESEPIHTETDVAFQESTAQYVAMAQTWLELAKVMAALVPHLATAPEPVPDDGG